MIVKLILTIGVPMTVITISFFQLVCTANVLDMKRVVYVNTLYHIPYKLIIKLKPISPPAPDTSDHISTQIIQEILKTSGVNFSKFEHYKFHKIQYILPHIYMEVTLPKP